MLDLLVNKQLPVQFLESCPGEKIDVFSDKIDSVCDQKINRLQFLCEYWDHHEKKNVLKITFLDLPELQWQKFGKI